MRISIFLLKAISLSFIIFSQGLTQSGTWTKIYDQEIANIDLKAVHFVNANIGWIIGNGYVYKTINGGTTWSKQNISFDNCSNEVWDVYFIDTQVGILVGACGIFKTVNGGTEWSRINTPISQLSDSHLYRVISIDFIDANTGFVAGSKGLIMKTTDGGSNWDVLLSGKSYIIESIDFVNSQTGWAVTRENGGSQGIILGTTDGGNSWSTQHSSSQGFMAAYFIDSNTGWVAGGNGKIMKTLNGGQDWFDRYSGTTFAIYDIHFVDSNLGWALTYNNGTSWGGILSTTNGGNNWSSSSSLGGSGVLVDIHFVDSNLGWVVGHSKQIIKYSDITSPTVTSVSSTANNGTYGIGSVIPITVTFSESVIVTGTPQLELNVRPAIFPSVDYSSGSGSAVLTFNYTVTEGDSSPDLEYTLTTALKLNGGTIKDAAGNAATLTLASPGVANSLGANKNIVIETTKPTVSSVTSTTNDGSYTEGGTVVVTVTFNEVVTVSGTPQLTLETGDTDAVVDYSSGSGTTILTFNYIVASGHGSSDLGYTSTSALSLNNGTINDLAGNAAVLTLPTPGSENSLSANKAILVDGAKPVVSIVSESPGVFKNTSFIWNDKANGDFINLNSNNDFTIQFWIKYIGPDEMEGNSFNVKLIEPKQSWENLGYLIIEIQRTGTFLNWIHKEDKQELKGSIRYEIGTDLSDVDASHLNTSGDLSVYGYLVKNKWYHFTLKKSTQNHTFKAYINGFELTNPKTWAGAWAGEPWHALLHENQNIIGLNTRQDHLLRLDSGLGGKPEGSPFWIIDELKVWNYSLSIEEIQSNLYTELQETPSSLIGYWKFNEGFGDTLFNSAGSTNNVSLIFNERCNCYMNTSLGKWYDLDTWQKDFSSSIVDLDWYGTGRNGRILMMAYDNVGIAKYEFSVGTSAGNEDVVSWFSSDTNYADIDLSSSTENIKYFSNGRVTDIVGYVSDIVSSDGFQMDFTKPIAGTVLNGDAYQADTNNVTLTWSGFSDKLSGINYYEYGLGTQPGVTDIIFQPKVGLIKSALLTDLQLENGQTYYGTVYAVDQVGNKVSATSNGLTIDVYPGAPQVLSVDSESVTPLSLSDDSEIKIYFTEPIRDYTLDLSSNIGSPIDIITQQDADSLIVTVKAPLASLDTLNLSLSKIVDKAGLTGDNTHQVSFYTALMADYNGDFKVNVEDLLQFVSLWPSLDLGPVTGDIPNFKSQSDGVANLRDVGVFTRMWHWSHANNGASSRVFTSIGEPITINHSSDKIIVSIPDNAIAGEILLEYQETDIDLGLSDEVTENRMVITNRDAVQGLLAVNFGYMKETQNKELGFSVQYKGKSNSDFTISYVYYNENNTVVNMGMQDFDLKAIPLEYALHENYPNPFNPTTTLRFDLPNVSDVNLTIYNMLGQKVKTFNMQNTPAGFHSLIWNATNDYGTPVGAGIYLYQLQTKDFVKTRKMVLLK